MLSSSKIINSYLDKRDWRVQENSNAPFSFGALGKRIVSEVSTDYWLEDIYTKEITEAHNDGSMHIHDLGGLTVYCCGYSIRSIIEKGVCGVPNIPTSSSARHFGALLNQLANLTTVFQNEIMGAVAFSSLDTYLAPYVKEDKLDYAEVKQQMQNYIFSINSNSRGGAEPAFTNVTFDLTPPRDLLDSPVWWGGTLLDYTYGDCQIEMDMINRAFYELMLKGDANNAPFAYPIPTYNIHDRFDWDNPNNDALWEMTGRFGYPYFANFINSDMDPSDARSMCCRLRLDLRQLQRRNGGLFGAGESTGSIGVVTLDLPKYAYLAHKKRSIFFAILSKYMDLAKESLEIKRAFLNEEILGKGLLPAFSTYVGTLVNHFSTIGVIGMNEMCMNFLGVNILHPEGKMFAEEVLIFMRERLIQYQAETGILYNLEATPAESTCYRLALIDKRLYPDIITQGTFDTPYYTNSCHIPVKEVQSIFQVLNHQDDLQVLFTGGTVVHHFLEGPISGLKAKNLIRTMCENYRIPYVDLSPLNRYCPEHGYVAAIIEECPTCGAPLELLQRITGYLRRVKFFNEGKQQEFKDRTQLKL